MGAGDHEQAHRQKGQGEKGRKPGKGKGANQGKAHAATSGSAAAPLESEKKVASDSASASEQNDNSSSSQAPVTPANQAPQQQQSQQQWQDDSWWWYDPWGWEVFFVQEAVPPGKNTTSHLTASSSLLSAWGAVCCLMSSPGLVILDLGCTKGMGSRAACAKFAKEAKRRGVQFECVDSQATFTFANRDTSVAKQKLRVWFNALLPVHTDFEIIEEGNVPILFSLFQMCNLGMQLHMSRDVMSMTRQAFGAYNLLLPVSASGHLVLDFLSLKRCSQSCYDKYERGAGFLVGLSFEMCHDDALARKTVT